MYRAHVEQRLADTKSKKDNFAVRNDLLAYSAFLESEKLWAVAAGILGELADLDDDVFGDPVEATRARCRQVFALVQDGLYDDAKRVTKNAVQRLNRSVSKTTALRTRLELALNCALVALHQRQFRVTLQIIDRHCQKLLNDLRQTDRANQYENCEAAMEIRRGAAQKDLGQLDEAQASLIAGIIRREKIGALVGQAHGLHHLAIVHLNRGDDHLSGRKSTMHKRSINVRIGCSFRALMRLNGSQSIGTPRRLIGLVASSAISSTIFSLTLRLVRKVSA